jgi:hypothetical protein
MGERRRGSVSGESEMNNAISRLRRGGDTIKGHPISKTPRAEALGKSEVLRDPSTGGLKRGERSGLVCSCGLLEAQQREIWPMGLPL